MVHTALGKGWGDSPGRHLGDIDRWHRGGTVSIRTWVLAGDEAAMNGGDSRDWLLRPLPAAWPWLSGVPLILGTKDA